MKTKTDGLVTLYLNTFPQTSDIQMEFQITASLFDKGLLKSDMSAVFDINRMKVICSVIRFKIRMSNEKSLFD